MTTTVLLEPPDGWRSVPPEAFETALAVIRKAVEPAVAVPRLTEYYRSDGNYAGATFVEVPRWTPTSSQRLTCSRSRCSA